MHTHSKAGREKNSFLTCQESPRLTAALISSSLLFLQRKRAHLLSATQLPVLPEAGARPPPLFGGFFKIGFLSLTVLAVVELTL